MNRLLSVFKMRIGWHTHGKQSHKVFAEEIWVVPLGVIWEKWYV